VADLATAYFQLRELDLELEISKRTFASRSDSLHLTTILEEHGIDSLLDVRQSEQLVYTAATEIPDFERQIALQENALASFWGISQAMFPADAGSPNNRTLPMCPPGFLHHCWNGDRTFGTPRKT
jgi:outer membrane protein, multidrug efflux system